MRACLGTMADLPRGLLALLGALVISAGAATPNAHHGSPASKSVLVERAVYLMGTRATLVAHAGERTMGLRRLERMVRILEHAEVELSTWRDDSLLSALNRQSPNMPWHAPASVCRLFGALFTWYRATDGAFDPAVGSLIDVWGLRRDGQRPTAHALQMAAARAGLRHVAFDPETCAVTRRVDVTIDAGGFGKGEALRRVVRAERTQSAEGWLIDFGGQIVVAGSPPAGGWPVAIAHPVWRDQPVLEVVLRTGSLATTGSSERNLYAGHDRIGHILDPRTARPVARSSSVTVWRDDALDADVLSTALYVMGVHHGLRWADAQGIAACFITPTGDSISPDVEFHATAAFDQRFLN